MTKLLLRLFVKNYENSEDMAVRASVGKLAGGMGIVCNGILFLGKLIAGILSGSVAIIADAVNNIAIPVLVWISTALTVISGCVYLKGYWHLIDSDK